MTPANSATPTGTLTKKTSRQFTSTSRPPRTAPAAKPVEATAPYTPSAWLRCFSSGQLVTSRDSPAGASRAAPSPWTALEAISSLGSTASPPAMLARTKTQSPIRYNLARPNTSASRPPSRRKPPKVTA